MIKYSAIGSSALKIPNNTCGIQGKKDEDPVHGI
jgi:hypothetical protein